MFRSLTGGLLRLGLISGAHAQDNAAADKAKTILQRAAEAAAAVAAKAQQAVAQAVAIRSPYRSGQERDAVDPQDAIERFALLTAGGPVVVQVTLTIDGQPFRIGREQ